MGGSVSLEGKPSLPYCCIDIGHNVSASDLYACELTGREKEIVRITWDKLVERSEEMSVTLFLRIFELIPYTKQFFPFRDFVGDDLVKHPYFKGHGMRFINALRMAVLNMNAKEVGPVTQRFSLLIIIGCPNYILILNFITIFIFVEPHGGLKLLWMKF